MQISTVSTSATVTSTSSNRTHSSASATPASSDATSQTLTSYLPASPQEDLTYGFPSSTYTWAGDATDSISRTMLADINASSWYGLKPSFKGLGAALLGRFTSTQADYSQHVTKGYSTIGAQAPAFGDSQIQLRITTASGKTINVTITFAGYSQGTDGSLGVQVSTEGTLTQNESKAVASLAEAFETALQGISDATKNLWGQDSSAIDLSGLMQYDSSAIGAIDLNVRETAQFDMPALTFHADSKQRSVSMQTDYGTTNFKVDLSNTDIIGTQAQQQTAISRYLAQFDAANARARGEAQLLEQFKGLFTQLESNLPGTPGGTGGDAQGPLNASSRQYLSGLADFQAGMQGKFANGISSGGHTTRAGSLDYQISQRTDISSRGDESRATQTVTARLEAKLAQSRYGAILDVEDGNYDVYTFHDTNTAVTTLAQQDGAVKVAATTQIVDELEQYRKLVNHRVTDSRDTPRHTVSSRNLLDAG